MRSVAAGGVSEKEGNGEGQFPSTKPQPTPPGQRYWDTLLMDPDARSAGAIGILCCLSPAGKLFGVEAPLTAEGTEISATQAGSLDHSGQLVECAPLLRWLGGGRHELTLLLPLAAPVVEGLGRDPGGAGDLGHALTVGRAHALAGLVAHSGVIGRFQGRRFGPLVDGSDRVDFFPDAGGLSQRWTGFSANS
jgi:hypothetical protein